MAMDRRVYKWFYDNIHCRYYDLLMKWCFLPFGGERRCRREMIASINMGLEDRILDAGCGTGNVTSAIAEKAGGEADITGLDLSSGMIRHAQKKNRFSNVSFIQGDVTATGFEDGFFDKVFISHAIHEMPREIRMDALGEARRILKDGGEVILLELDKPGGFPVRLFVAFWFFYWLPCNFETPTRRDMLEHGLSREVEEAGFRDVRKALKFNGVFQVVQGVKSLHDL
jgi:demethylmenaquinone methyltransferase/2-methoxy-6-polyprenyl-1,4-benzoquinol methylase